MAQFILIGLCAGVATAVLFASPASGWLPAILIAQLAPLPILIAGLGWSHWAALIAALSSAAALGSYLGVAFSLAFLLSVSLPTWWLSYLSLLARPSADGSGAVEWYPVGRLVLWATVLGAAVTAIGVIRLGGAADGFEVELKTSFEKFLREWNGTPSGAQLTIPGVNDPERFLQLLALVFPPAKAVVTCISNVFYLWLAGRIVSVSGRLPRPWPDLAEMRVPAAAALAFVATMIAGSLSVELPGTLCRVFAASLLVAYMLVGFAVLHALTRHLQSRFFVLASAYAAVLVFQWPTFIVLLLGLTDPLFDLRARVAARRRPPQLPTS
jgi:hypothetical protein